MAEIGIRELKAQASEIIRAVREQGVQYVITHRGRAVGILLPLEASPTGEARLASEGAAVWHELCALGAAIGRGRTSDQDSAALLAELRR